MRRPIIIAAVGCLAVLLVLVGTGGFWYERPARLTVAISNYDTEDAALVAAAANSLKLSRRDVRLRIDSVSDPAAASAAVDAGRADLAVIRSDVAIPSHAQTVVILHRDAALLAAPASGDVHAIGDLVGRTVGVIHRGIGNEKLLETALAQYDIRPDAVKVVALAPEDVAHAIESKAVDAILAVDVISSARLRDVVKAIAAAGGDAPVFLPIAEAAAIAQRSPAYEKVEVVRGTFGGTPPRPAEEFDTISITHRLVADEKISTGVITDLTRFFLTEKQQLSASVPVAMQIEAPSTDKGAAMPVHAGSAAYIDDDEETFFDKYSDYIYIGAMLMGVLASGATALISQIGRGRAAVLDHTVNRLLEMLRQVRSASSTDELDTLQFEADGLLSSALEVSKAADDRRLANFTLALDQVRAAIRDRRPQLAGPAPGHLARAAE